MQLKLVNSSTLTFSLHLMILTFQLISSQNFKTKKHLTKHHPFLYFDQEEVPRLRIKAQTTHTKISKQIEEAGRLLKEQPNNYLPPESHKKFASKWNEIYGNNLCAFAMYCLLYPNDKKAFELVKTFMNRLTSFPSWYVATSPGDEVPIGHTLTGFITTFDFLHERFNEKAKNNYLQKIRKEANNLYSIYRNQRAGWTRQHVHNHAPTLLLPMLLSSFVYEQIDPNVAAPWKNASVTLFEKALLLFSYITDGSIDEGVAYGSYTTRGLFQYVFLAKRHFEVDHTNNPWLRQQIWFNFATLLPGFQRTVGIADSNHNWFYGPECQLVFLDAYVLRNGWGNWLADHVRENRAKNSPLAPSGSQKWSLTHLELVFYDAEIKPVRPRSQNNSRLHIFHDWGVVTYGGGESLGENSTFLSFKSSALNGEAVADVVERGLPSASIQPGWWHFNPGHEHPDQNSFVFAPNGRYFISEALYGPKQTSLNCALMFSPAVSKDICEAPWQGQIGECSKWLKYKESPVPRGRIVTASQQNGMVHIAGEAVNAYRSELELKSVQRSLLLLSHDILVVVDSIYLNELSKVDRVSAYFQNVMQEFQPYNHRSYNGAQVNYPEGAYTFFWFRSDGYSPEAVTSKLSDPSKYRAKQINMVNITFNLLNSNTMMRSMPTQIAYIFAGPGPKITAAKFEPSSNQDFVRLTMTVNDVVHRIELASLISSPSRRFTEFGFKGFARVSIDGKIYSFGKNSFKGLRRCDVNQDRYSARQYTRSLAPSSDEISSKLKKSLDFINKQIKNREESEQFSYMNFFIHNPLTLLTGLLLLLLVISRIVSHSDIRWKKQKKFYALVLLTLAIWCLISIKFSCIPLNKMTTKKFETSCENDSYDLLKSSTIIITSLPYSGAEILQLAFANTSDFLYLSNENIKIPSPSFDLYETSKLDLCEWPAWSTSMPTFMKTAGWFQSMKLEPALLLNNIFQSNEDIPKIQRRFRSLKRSGTFVLNLFSGFWNTKLNWLRESLGEEMRPILVIRDPRDWIYTLTRKDVKSHTLLRRKQMIDEILQKGVSECSNPANTLRGFEHAKFKQLSKIEQLARVWAISVSEAVNQGKSLQIVRFEDIIRQPVHTITEMLKLYGALMSIPQINRISRFVHSGHYSLPYDGPLERDYIDKWRNSMLIDDVRKIEKICGSLMETFMYKHR